MIKEKVKRLIDQTLTNLGIEPIAYSLEEPPANFPADWASNVALLLSKKLRENPQNLAKRIAGNLSVSGILEKVEIAGPGFLNLYLKPAEYTEEIERINREGECYGVSDKFAGKRVNLEFVSANPTGPLHIGHGRGAAFGDTLGRIFSALGYTVEKEYYVNDVGNQMDVLAKSVDLRLRELQGEKIEFPAECYQGDYLKEIAGQIAEKKKNYSREELRKIVQEEILSYIQEELVEFGVGFDRWFFESSLYDSGKVQTTLDLLKKKGYAYEKDGAVWFKSTDFGDEKDRVVVREDGRHTYLASDIAYHRDKFERGYDLLIDIWGADHHGYVARVKGAIKSAGYEEEKLKIILYQLVRLLRDGKPVAMSTRSGEFVTLTEVVKEVGRDACRFFFLMRGSDAQLDFDLELAKKQSKENPVFYVQYAHTRIAGIFREAQKQAAVSMADKFELNCLSPLDLALMKKLARYPETLEAAARDYAPHYLTIFLQDIADAFHNYYEKQRILTEDLRASAQRLRLLQAVKIILANGLGLLGVSAPEKM
ncbi:MAG: arginine--tRNA ligase [Elusimicrobiota bacterium]